MVIQHRASAIEAKGDGMPDALDSVRALASDYRRLSKAAEAEDQARAKRQSTIASNLESVAAELDLARKRLRPVSNSYGDLSDLPEELIEQLNLTKIDELEQQIRDIVASADGAEMGIDPILIELYRRHKVMQTRKFLMNKLYRMAQKEIINAAEGKKGYYFLPKPWVANQGGFADDLDDDIPF